jgi:hypothetical protein
LPIKSQRQSDRLLDEWIVKLGFIRSIVRRGVHVHVVLVLPTNWCATRAVGSINFAMGQAIGRVYVARYFPSEAKAQIDDLVAHLRIALKERIARLDWMSPQTKVKALDKMARLNVKLESRSLRNSMNSQLR